MGYTWTSVSAGDKILADHWNEIKTNLDSLYSDLDLNTRNWVNFPVSQGSLIKYDHLSELRDATDYADDQNYCRDHDATYNVTVNDGEDATYNSGDKGTYNNNANSGVDNDHHSTYKGTVNSTYHSSDKGADHDSGHNSVDRAHDNVVY